MISKCIREAIVYAKLHLHLDEEDAVYVENLLLKLFKADSTYEGEIEQNRLESLSVPDEVIAPMQEYLVKELGYDEGAAEREMAYVMGLLSPMPSKVNEVFYDLAKQDPSKATDYLYELSIANNYIAKTKVDKNIHFDATYEKGADLEISINLSKPEKNNKDIAKLVNAKSSGYPKCLLCHENLGYAGHERHPARENIRFIPLNLGGERWYMQYSPYVYFDHHCILFYEHHVNMEINRRIFSKLFDFVDLFPHFFIGSNSDLPIVGGSILNHEHFQGGKHIMPIMKAPAKREFSLSRYKKTKLFEIDFYNTVLLLEGEDREEILDVAEDITDAWRKYDDVENDIIANDKDGIHSTVTPILRKVGKTYKFLLILRNNRTNEKYPDGIFHVHPELFHIKKEGIGLIEAAGLFILPARLKRQNAEIEEVVKEGLNDKAIFDRYPDLSEFGDMIEKVRGGMSCNDYIAAVCQKILDNIATFKHDEKGEKGLEKFIKECKL